VIILVHTAFRHDNVQHNLGQPEYSYYFVLREFLPLLEGFGHVIDIRDPEKEVDTIYRASQQQGIPCIFLSFMPPNKTPIGLACPTVPVFAWEYSTLPNESFGNKPRNDWRRVLTYLGHAITHSTFAADAVRSQLGAHFPILVAPAPLWNRMAARQEVSRQTQAHVSHAHINVEGLVIDSLLTDLTPYSMTARRASAPTPLPLPKERQEGPSLLTLDGIVYTSVFNPGDGRKNWLDMIGAFCEAFRHATDATLFMKLSHHDISEIVPDMLECLHKAGDFACRVVIFQGYLPQEDYERLVDATSYAVNCSHGEGQCLPLMEYMSCGKPAISPRHTAMDDYVDESCAFIVKSSLVPGTWPHDQRQAFRTLREQVHFGSLVQAYRASHYVARHEPLTYACMAQAAIRSLQGYCSREAVGQPLRQFLDRVAGRSLQPNKAMAP